MLLDKENNGIPAFAGIDKIKNMPKVELHLHMEGAIPLELMWELVRKYDTRNEVKSLEELRAKFQFVDFPHFIETWVWKNKFIREYADFTLIARAVAEDLLRQNIIYAEIFYSPPDFRHRGLDSRKITEAIRKGLDEVNGIKVNLVADLVRDFGAENGMRTLLEINEVKTLGVAGIGIGGSEHEFPPEIFENVFQKARELGFKTSAHAGEASGAESIWGTVRSLKVDRIGHGTRAYEDESLLNYLIEKQIPIEMCPLSNVKTGVVKKIEEHPVKDYYKKGLKVFVNTDDSMMFNNSLDEEYFMLISKMGFGIHDVRKIALNAIDSAWCTIEYKRELSDKLISYFESISKEEN